MQSTKDVDDHRSVPRQGLAAVEQAGACRRRGRDAQCIHEAMKLSRVLKTCYIHPAEAEANYYRRLASQAATPA